MMQQTAAESALFAPETGLALHVWLFHKGSYKPKCMHKLDFPIECSAFDAVGWLPRYELRSDKRSAYTWCHTENNPLEVAYLLSHLYLRLYWDLNPTPVWMLVLLIHPYTLSLKNNANCIVGNFQWCKFLNKSSFPFRIYFCSYYFHVFMCISCHLACSKVHMWRCHS